MADLLSNEEMLEEYFASDGNASEFEGSFSQEFKIEGSQEALLRKNNNGVRSRFCALI
jgi:hypothetical protein